MVVLLFDSAKYLYNMDEISQGNAVRVVEVHQWVTSSQSLEEQSIPYPISN